MIFRFKESKNTSLNLQKLGPSTYMFGTKKISAKIMNGILLVRVGGGYLSIEEFYNKNVEIELQKQMRAEESNYKKEE
jgi:hypothetical protein